MRIKKTSQMVTTDYQVNGSYSTSQSEAYNCLYVNDLETAINNLKPVVLYNNATGSTTSVTLSDSAANYTYLEIYFAQNQGVSNCTKLFSPEGKSFSMMTLGGVSSSGSWFQLARGTVSGTTITITNGTQFQVKSTGVSDYSATNYLSIKRVVGYK